MWQNLNARRWNVAGVVLFIALAVGIFWEVLPATMAPIAGDAMPFFPFGYRTWIINDLLARGGEVTPHLGYGLIFSPLLANKLNYLIDTFFLVLASAYYLRSRGTSRFAAWIGGLALGFSGYTFTLLLAGHRGHFDMFACVIFAFGLLVRCFRGRNLFHFAMLGACLAWGGPYQADVFVFLGMLIGAYALWLTFSRASDPATTPWQRIKRVYPRFLLTGLVALLIGWPGFRKVIDEQIAGRKQQIISANGVLTSQSAGVSAVEEQKKWIFATNWSLPPEDMTEFVVPGIFGNDSMQLPYPYWGRLGRPYDWTPGQRVMPNYRQHTVYLGVLTVSFALFAVLVWWRRRKPAGDVGNIEFSTGEDASVWADVPFWLVAGVVCLVLAMGRYTPVYHLFYSIPYMSLIRCPVKFHHLVEICVSFLCGLGVEAWARGAVVAAKPAKRKIPSTPTPGVVVAWRIQMVILGLAVVSVLIAAGMSALARTDNARSIAQLGFGSLADALAGYQVENLLRSALFFGVVAALFGLGRPRAGRVRPATSLLILLAAALAFDLGPVAQRFVRPIDMGPFYAANCVTDAAREHDCFGAGVANYATSNESGRDWFANSLAQNGLRLALPTDAEGADVQVVQALGKRTETLWRALHARVVIANWKDALPLVNSQLLRPLVSFSLGQGTVRQVTPSADACVLALYTGAMPDTYVVDHWRAVTNEQEQIRIMGDGNWDSARMTLCDAPASNEGDSHSIGHARIIHQSGLDFHFTTAVDVEAPQSGLLVTNERYALGLIARLDGHRVPVRCANALWVAVEIPAGRHAVVISRERHCLPVLLSAGAGLCLGSWGLIRMLGRQRRKDKTRMS